MADLKTYPALVRRAERLESKAKEAVSAATTARYAIRKHGMDRFIAALAKRGIKQRDTLIVIKGEAATARKVAIPDAVGRIEWLGQPTPPNENSQWWWYRIQVSRQKKRGGFYDRSEAIYCHGKTPEEAAKMVEKWNG